MEKKKHCKWYNDEFCTNADSPCVADYCPVVEYPELCKHREVDKDINVRSKDIREFVEFDEYLDDLFVEFDEYGFAPTITMPNSEEFAIEWKKGLLDLIHRLQDESATQKEEIALLNGGRENLLADKILLQEEIERLTSLYDGQSAYMTSGIGDLPLTVEGLRKAVDEIARLYLVQAELQDYNEKNYNEAKDLRRKNAELQKQVDELTEERENMQDVILGLEDKLANVLLGIKDDEVLIAKGVEQAVKDTAKEILAMFNDSNYITENELQKAIAERYGVSYEENN